MYEDTGFGPRTWSVVFILKVAASCLNLLVMNRVYGQSDLVSYYWESMADLKRLPSEPFWFFKEWLLNWGDISQHLNIFNPSDARYWTDLGKQFHYKFMTLSNLLSLGNLYVNTIFFGFAFFCGQLLLYRVFYSRFREDKWALLLAVFFVPAVWFWCSSINKDGWVLTAFGIILFAVHRIFYENKKSWLMLFAGLFLLFIVRYFYFVLFLPLLISWLLLRKQVWPVHRTYLISMTVLLFLFFLPAWLIPEMSPTRIIANKQAEFLQLRGGSDMYLPTLNHSPWSYVRALPYAFDHVFLRPYPLVESTWRYHLASCSTWFEFLLIIGLMLRMKKYRRNELIPTGLMYFTLVIYLVIGFTVPNLGAIVRYKSEFTALLIPSLVVLADFRLPQQWSLWLERLRKPSVNRISEYNK